MLLIANLVLIFIFNTFHTAKSSKLANSLAMELLLNTKINTVVSPLLVRFPLCKLTSEAEGTTKSDLLSILGIKSKEVQNCYTEIKDVLEGMSHMDFLSLNKIIVNYTDDVKLQFISNGANYGIKVDKIGFNYPSSAISFINRWVDKATLKRVTDVLEPNDINNKSSMLIINAAYLKVTWEIPFDITLTKNAKFYQIDGKVSTVSMMTKMDTCLYFQDENMNIQFVTMKLASFGITMSIALPETRKGLSELLHKLLQEPNYFDQIQNNMKFETIKINLPRFKIKNCFELDKYLKKIGASQLFNETYSGLDRILKKNSTSKNIHLSKVKQKIFIDIDEMGIFRKLPGEMYDETHGLAFGSTEVVGDHPFYFTVNLQTSPLENARRYHLFQGVYYGPEN
ncbi:serine protease inhibitor 3/4-like isoform X1 [Danaus plexippus]|uniref:serine protease inhibitor 3/4-like isoform X1 n=1 Tax=Danaus plexippus TaxID=13037 RepID=UPI002AB07B34|nr:serine protease inhibitor 3/4-like isoform X1 [Danaus plexippus]